MSQQIAKNLKEVYFGGNWTASNLRHHLDDVSWKEAITKVHNLNTIAILVYHLHYYVRIDTVVLEGGELKGKDEESFSHPTINSEEDWQAMLSDVWKEADHFIQLIDKIKDEQLWEDFVDAKYGNYYRNLQGIVEHTHYHLGQIVLIKKILRL